jgi:hypothetical protein
MTASSPSPDFDAFLCDLRAHAVGRGDVHCAVFFNVNLYAGLFLQARMFLPPGPISAPILSTGIFTVMMRGACGFDSGARFGQHCQHLFHDGHARHLRLFERFLHHLRAQAADLDVHLQGGDARRRSSHFEVHVAEVIFGALNVGQNLVTTGAGQISVINPIATPETGALIGTPASINASVEPQTEPIEVEPLDDKASDTTRRCTGTILPRGITGSSARSANAP